MNKMLVAVFNTEEKAFEGLSALKSLHKDGDISVHATGVIAKDDQGEVTIKDQSSKGPIGTSVGMLGGALIGLLGGPAGMLAGAAVGGLGGMLYDLDQTGIDAGFVQEVSEALGEDKVAVIADVEESWTAPVDTRIESLGGMVFRRNRYEVAEDQLAREADEINAELEELDTELREAEEEARASIQEQIDRSNEKMNALKEVVDKKQEQLNAEMKAKEESLEKQLAEAKERNRKKIQKRLSDVKADFSKRKEKLSSVVQKTAGYVT